MWIDETWGHLFGLAVADRLLVGGAFLLKWLALDRFHVILAERDEPHPYHAATFRWFPETQCWEVGQDVSQVAKTLEQLCITYQIRLAEYRLLSAAAFGVELIVHEAQLP